MRKLFITLLVSLLAIPAFAQIPSFHRVAGDKTMYSFAIVDWNPKTEALSSFSSYQWGIGDYFSTGVSFSNSLASQNMAFVARTGVKINKHFGIGGMLNPWFNLNRSMKYSHLSGWIAINGDVAGNLSYCTNTNFNIREQKMRASQLSYIAYTIGIDDNWSLTPMVGGSFSWAFNETFLPSAGLFLAYKEWGFYVWGRQLVTGDPSIEFSIEFRLR